MRLYLLRHGPAVERGTPGFEQDADRPLTPKGRRKMEKICAYFAQCKLEFEHILTSPYVRTRETAELLGKVYRNKPRILTNLAPGLEPVALRQELSEQFPQAGSLVLVGHEPDLSQLACSLIAAPAFSLAGIKKGGVAALHLASWESLASLEFLLTPRMMLRE